MYFRYFLKGLLLPPFVQIIAILTAWSIRHRKPRFAWGLCLLSIISLWVLGTPVTATLLGRSLEKYPAIVPDRLNTIKADAIVILSARQIDVAPEFGQPVSGTVQLSRLRYGAYLHRRTGIPILLCGGAWTRDAQTSLAETMAYDLREGFGVNARWLEIKSRTTMENALSSYAVLAAEDKTSIVLVTSAIHMMRAKWSFEQAGFDVLPAPTGAMDKNPIIFNSFIPTAFGLSVSSQAIHEWLGYWVYRLLRSS